MLQQVVAGILSFVVASALLPWVIAFAREHELLDFPDGARRVHSTPIPRLGGVAIFGAAMVAAAAVFEWDRLSRAFHIQTTSLLPGTVIGCAIVFATGVVDDVRGVRPIYKLIAQTAAAIIVVSYGFVIQSVSFAGDATIQLGLLAIPITVVWMVGMANAFNLIDGVDGLAGTFALLGLTTAIAVDLWMHENTSLVITLALLGAIFAFLRYNRAPARIFLGDSGSMLLGFYLSIKLVMSATTAEHVTFALVPLFALAYPILDTCIAIARRWLRGHPFSRADGRHVHHQLLALGLTARQTVDVLGFVFACVAVLGLSITFAPPQVTLALVVGGATLGASVCFYAIHALRYTEFIEFGSSVASVVRNARVHVRNKILANDIAAKLHKAESLEEFAAMLSEAASELGLLDINILLGGHYVGPSARQIWPHGNRPYRIDYPISWEREGLTQDAVLRLWCERPDGRRHHGSERIASRLAPAIEGWFTNTPASVPVVPEGLITGEHKRVDEVRRSSGKTKQH